MDWPLEPTGTVYSSSQTRGQFDGIADWPLDATGSSVYSATALNGALVSRPADAAATIDDATNLTGFSSGTINWDTGISESGQVWVRWFSPVNAMLELTDDTMQPGTWGFSTYTADPADPSGTLDDSLGTFAVVGDGSSFPPPIGTHYLQVPAGQWLYLEFVAYNFLNGQAGTATWALTPDPNDYPTDTHDYVSSLSNTYGALAVQLSLVGETVDSRSELNGTIEYVAEIGALTGSVTSRSDLSGDIVFDIDYALNGTTTSQSILSGEIIEDTDSALSGTATSRSDLSGQIKTMGELTGLVVSRSDLSGEIIASNDFALSGLVVSQTPVGGVIVHDTDFALTGLLVSRSVLSGVLVHPINLVGSVVSRTDLVGLLVVERFITVALSAVAAPGRKPPPAQIDDPTGAASTPGRKVSKLSTNYT